MEQYIQLIQHDVTLINDKFEEFQRTLIPLDDFFSKLLAFKNTLNSPMLWR